ncbi:hypothetical protein [Paenibacillus sp. TC-CSREp1]|uniref:hypothetical protein n=1 Tax=Paenibacillus sp. TC-CSREp1 TaxID=3410089 RepID=UPI003CEDC629
MKGRSATEASTRAPTKKALRTIIPFKGPILAGFQQTIAIQHEWIAVSSKAPSKVQGHSGGSGNGRKKRSVRVYDRIFILYKLNYSFTR